MIAPVLDIWSGLDGYRVVFARADTFETLGEFSTLREAGDAKREAERLGAVARQAAAS